MKIGNLELDRHRKLTLQFFLQFATTFTHYYPTSPLTPPQALLIVESKRRVRCLVGSPITVIFLVFPSNNALSTRTSWFTVHSVNLFGFFSLRIYSGVKLLFASCIFLTYFLQFYVSMVIIQPVILKHVPEEYQDVADFAIRAATVIFTCEYKPIIVFKGVLLRWYCCFRSVLYLRHY